MSKHSCHRFDNINSCVELGVNYRGYGIDEEYAKSLVMTAAKAGDDEAMRIVMIYYKSGCLEKDDLAATLRANQAASIEVRSENRDFAKRYLADEHRRRLMGM